MAIAYQTGSATDVTDLLDKLRIFLLAQGWTVNGFVVITNGKRLSLLSPAGNYFELASDTSVVTGANPSPYIKVCACRGYASGSAFNAQSGTSGETWANRLTGPFTAYHFFVDSSYAHIVIEITSGVFSHIQIGAINKFCTFTGGEYAAALNWYMSGSGYQNTPVSGYHNVPWENQNNSGNAKYSQFRADIDSVSDKWHGPHDSATYRFMSNTMQLWSQSTAGISRRIWSAGPSSYNQNTPLIPLYAIVVRASTNQSILGVAPDVRGINMKNYAPGATITIGSEQWLVFPWTQKSDAYNVPADAAKVQSYYYGFAYRKA